MKPHRKKKLLFIFFIITGVSVASAMVLYTLKENINLYYTPSQLKNAFISPQQVIRIGGIVKPQSVVFAKKNLQVRFFVADKSNQIQVIYAGILPALFRAGQGIVVEGRLNNNILFADQVLAKHDEKYVPLSLS